MHGGRNSSVGQQLSHHRHRQLNTYLQEKGKQILMYEQKPLADIRKKLKQKLTKQLSDDQSRINILISRTLNLARQKPNSDSRSYSSRI